MSNGIYRHGKIDRIIRPMGIGAIKPDKSGPVVIFPSDAVKGGRNGFDNLEHGQKVKYRTLPGELGPIEIAEDVMPDDL